MTYLEWLRDPPVDQPVVIAAFNGWDDAGDAASIALDELIDGFGARPVAQLDPEDFHNFTAERPHLSVADDGLLTIDWPSTTIWHATTPRGTDVLFLGGDEPQLRWRTYCSTLIDAMVVRRCRLVLTLGSLLADIPHTRDTPVYGNGYSDTVCDALGFERARSDERAGISAVMHAMCQQRRVNSAGLWAAVPSYVSATGSPKAALALVRRVLSILGAELDLDDLVEQTIRYETEVSEAVGDNAETRSYVAELEERFDNRRIADESSVHLVEQVEEFLKEH